MPVKDKIIRLSAFRYVLGCDGDFRRTDGDTLQDVREIALENEVEFVQVDVTATASESHVPEPKVASGSTTECG